MLESQPQNPTHPELPDEDIVVPSITDRQLAFAMSSLEVEESSLEQFFDFDAYYRDSAEKEGEKVQKDDAGSSQSQTVTYPEEIVVPSGTDRQLAFMMACLEVEESLTEQGFDFEGCYWDSDGVRKDDDGNGKV
ncbi:hypothetical protein HYFRA_00010045 [Hymenoscyphus fraxineus]|uniref:Uncharacterized protein n=1 Tax=Hymenoscyphus fraxineus TaxID=746836 RepID=A0A9N9PNJ3_9HELO|nr:hypothetical protein HYFRA_00010045 [Hymenoscyphus fraxineus]